MIALFAPPPPPVPKKRSWVWKLVEYTTIILVSFALAFAMIETVNIKFTKMLIQQMAINLQILEALDDLDSRIKKGTSL